ncbi:MAG: potassium-transporting ATPase subunit [Verrucomicrobiaceae bacterium]|nr:potassium-transporting ATPase subunit [Verrucomicrobiaceae bacterium]
MKTLLRPALSIFIALSLITGVLYPLAVTAIGRIGFSQQAAGSVIMINGNAVGSRWIGQNFSKPEYFWGRLSATAPQPYNAGASSGSNLGPLNPALIDSVKARIASLQAVDANNPLPIPVDLVTASGSGLDPEISPAAARYQIARVATARKVSTDAVSALVEQNTQGRQFRIFGEPRVNVLALNIALDKLH